MIEIIQVTDDDNTSWQKYFDVSQRISRMHYPESFKAEATLESFRKMRTRDESYTAGSDFILAENNEPIGWMDMAIVDGEFYLGFDLLSEEVTESALRAVFTRVKELMAEHKYNKSEYYSHRGAIKDKFTEINAPVSDEIMISRLLRSDMNIKMYEDINKGGIFSGWKDEFFVEIPGSIMDNYIECMNRFSDDITSLNPYKRDYPPYTAESWAVRERSFARLGLYMLMVILFDYTGKIAGMCSVYTDENRRELIRHNGGITGVTHKYRGKGIGRFLKAKMHLKLLEENKDFRYITTDTMPWNIPMWNINREFGFKEYRKGNCFKLSTEFIENYLKLK